MPWLLSFIYWTVKSSASVLRYSAPTLSILPTSISIHKYYSWLVLKFSKLLLNLILESVRHMTGWIVFILIIYVIGLTHIGHVGENYFFTIGGIFVVIAWGVLAEYLKEWLQQSWPAVAAKIFGSAGSVYFSGALLGLVSTTLLSFPQLKLIAENVMIVVYYCLLVGITLEILALRSSCE